jgi:hypothetical protein
MSTCGANARLSGGRRRTRKMRGGTFYGFAGGVGNTSAGPQWNAVENLAANPVNGRLIPNDGSEMKATKLGGRRRKSKKATRKGGKHRKGHRRSRKMRGGASYQSVAGVGAAFKGEGVAGLGNYSPYASKVPPSGGPTQGADGVYQP